MDPDEVLLAEQYALKARFGCAHGTDQSKVLPWMPINIANLIKVDEYVSTPGRYSSIIQVRRLRQQVSMNRTYRIAIVTSGLASGGGVPALVEWLSRELAVTKRYSIDIHELATHSRDANSRLVSSPRTLLRRSLRNSAGESEAWGANIAELEFMRYRPRKQLTNALNDYDLVQVISGGPALADATKNVSVPVSVLFATRVAWERAEGLRSSQFPVGAWQRSMTKIVSQQEDHALKRVGAVQVLNREVRDYVLALGQQHVQVAAYGVDTQKFTPVDQWNPGGAIVTVCRLGDPRKGLQRLVASYQRLLEFQDDAPDLILAGYGTPDAQTLELIKSPALVGRVKVRSNVAQHELAELLRNASIFAQASYEEGLGISVLEAMASGIPVVATETAGTNETVVDGVTGYLLPQSSHDAFKDAFAQALAAALEEGAGLGSAGRQRASRKFANEIALGTFTSEYERLLS